MRFKIVLQKKIVDGLQFLKNLKDCSSFFRDSN